MMKTAHALLLAGAVAAACPSVGWAQAAPVDLTLATIEELMNLRVTSVSRKSQRAEDAPAAIYVITRSDIRRSGLTTLAEILRLAPGVQVSQASASRWAVSIRGFADVYSNKLLVLIDGRSVYSRTFSGVFWDLQDVVIADIDRIEVIRGPGGVAWGANAVNGVINVITRPATETQGLAVDVGAGTFARARAGVRFGGTVGETAYRVFSQWTDHADSWPAERARVADHWRSLTSGARIDWSRGADAVVAQGHFTTNWARTGWLLPTSLVPGLPPAPDAVSRNDETSALGRWTRTWTNGQLLQVQAYHTTMRRAEPIASFSEYSTDLDVQYETRFSSRHAVVFGGGARHVGVSAGDTFAMKIGSSRINTFNAFLQDELSVSRDLALTFGSRLEHDTFGGWGLSPSARIMWEASATQRLWAAASRTRRTPAVFDRSLRVTVAVVPGPALPLVFAFEGNPEYENEHLLQTEAGYRIRVHEHVAVDATMFTGSYDNLRTNEPFEPTVELTPAPAHVLAGNSFGNFMNARASGVELNVQWHPLAQYQLDASYGRLHTTTDVDAASLDATSADGDGNAPAAQWQVRSTFALRPGVQVDARVSHVGRLRLLGVPAYTRLDARAEFSVNRRLTAAVVGRNLASSRHQEFSDVLVARTSTVPRSVRIDLRWEF